MNVWRLAKKTLCNDGRELFPCHWKKEVPRMPESAGLPGVRFTALLLSLEPRLPDINGNNKERIGLPSCLLSVFSPLLRTVCA